MEPTTEQINALAKLFCCGQNGDEDGWEELYLTADEVERTRDTLDNFRAAARETWASASPCEGQHNGGLYWDEVQTARGETRVALAVLDCGDFRITYKE